MSSIALRPCARLHSRLLHSTLAAPHSTHVSRLPRRSSPAAAPRAIPEGGGEEISDVMREDLERYQRRQAPAPVPVESASNSIKETFDKILIADFFLVLFIMVWLAAGVAQAGLNGGSSFLLDTWYPLWPLLWQPAIGVLMAGALASGGMAWLQSQGQDK